MEVGGKQGKMASYLNWPWENFRSILKDLRRPII